VTPAPTFFATPAEFRAWLTAYGATASEVHVGFVKTHTGRAGLTWPQAVDEALCVGWIDAVRHRIDDEHYRIRFTPRKPSSHWSAVNINRIPVLEAEGRMTPAGRAAFAQRSETRSRRASYEQETPPELSPAELRVFRKNAAAWNFFEAQPPSYRRVAIWRVIRVKQQATRERQLAKLVAACAERRRL